MVVRDQRQTLCIIQGGHDGRPIQRLASRGSRLGGTELMNDITLKLYRSIMALLCDVFASLPENRGYQ